MKKSDWCAVTALAFSISSVSFCLGRQVGLAAGMAGIAFIYAVLAYGVKKKGL